MRAVLVPRDAGNFSAWGLLVSDERHDFVRSFIQPLFGADLDHAKRLFEEMEHEGRAALEQSGFPEARVIVRYRLDMRYIGQAFEEEITLTELADILSPQTVGGYFRDAYSRRYGYTRSIEMAETSNLRVTVVGVNDKPQLGTAPLLEAGDTQTAERPVTRPVYFDGTWTDFTIRARAEIAAGSALAGPAILQEYDSTTVLPPGWQATADHHGNILLERRLTQ